MIPEGAVDPQDIVLRLRQSAQPLTPIPTGQRPRLRPLPGIRAVLFDVYGTLFISASGDIASANQEARGQAMGGALGALGIPVDAGTASRAAALLVQIIGREHARLRRSGTEHPEVDIREVLLQVLRFLRKGGLLREKPGRRLCEILAVDYECRINPTWPMPGLAGTLGALKSRGLRLGIISNAQFFTPLLFPAHLGRHLEALGFDTDLCVWSYRRREAKPSANLFRQALRLLDRRGFSPGQILYAGNDRINDIRPAAELGLRTALFAGDRRSYRPHDEGPRRRQPREDVLFTELQQLLEVLDASAGVSGHSPDQDSAAGPESTCR